MTIRRVLVLLFAAAALAACGDTSSSSAAAPARAGLGVPAMAPAAQAGTSGSTGAAPAQAASTDLVVGTPSSNIERSVVASYTVPPGTFLAAFQDVVSRAVGLGGFVVTSSTQPDAGGRMVSGSATFKVPAAKLADLLNGMPSSFVTSSIDFSSIDHTAQFVDVNARLASAHAHLEALDALLAKATSLGDITTLEQQVETVQAEVDADQGELNVLTASVDLSTATVRLSERGSTAAPVPPPNAVSGGIHSGWDNAVQVTGAVLEGVTSALPLLLLAGVAALVWRRLTPARRRSRPID